jgi:hypothetical protein
LGARDAQLGAAFLLAPARRCAGEAGEGRERGMKALCSRGEEKKMREREVGPSSEKRGMLCCGVARRRKCKGSDP